MNIRDVAERTGLSAYTIRFYEKTGLLPAITRTKGGVRQFTEADVVFLKFVAALKETGMSLDNIADFTRDGCILERLQKGEMPIESVDRRIAILTEHRCRLRQQLEELGQLVDAVNEKIDFYEAYLNRRSDCN